MNVSPLFSISFQLRCLKTVSQDSFAVSNGYSSFLKEFEQFLFFRFFGWWDQKFCALSPRLFFCVCVGYYLVNCSVVRCN
jgi:hypothetical protein